MNSEHGGNVFAIARSLGIQPEELSDFSASINPLGPAPAVREALAAAYARLVHYPESDANELREALASYHSLTAANICPGNGSTELIYLLPRLIPGGRTLLLAPPFSEYAAACDRAGCEVEYFTLLAEEGFALPLDRLAETLQGRFRLLILANPGNPTGRLYRRNEIAGLLDLCRQSNTFVVIDEAFIDFCEEESAKELVAGQPRSLLLRSMTKFFALPGLRLGYAIGAPAVIARLADLREPWSVNTMAQVAGVASLADRDYIATTREYIAMARGELAARLAAVDGLKVFPAAANFLLLQLTGGRTATELARRLRQERILVRECGNFVGLDERFFRLAVRSEAENSRLVAAISSIMADYNS